MYWRRSNSSKMRRNFLRSSRKRFTMASAWDQRPLSAAAEGVFGPRLPLAGALRADKTRSSSGKSRRSILVKVDGFAIGLLASFFQPLFPFRCVQLLRVRGGFSQCGFQIHLFPLVRVPLQQEG